MVPIPLNLAKMFKHVGHGSGNEHVDRVAARFLESAAWLRQYPRERGRGCLRGLSGLVSIQWRSLHSFPFVLQSLLNMWTRRVLAWSNGTDRNSQNLRTVYDLVQDILKQSPR